MTTNTKLPSFFLTAASLGIDPSIYNPKTFWTYSIPCPAVDHESVTRQRSGNKHSTPFSFNVKSSCFCCSGCGLRAFSEEQLEAFIRGERSAAIKMKNQASTLLPREEIEKAIPLLLKQSNDKKKAERAKLDLPFGGAHQAKEPKPMPEVIIIPKKAEKPQAPTVATEEQGALVKALEALESAAKNLVKTAEDMKALTQIIKLDRQ